MNSEVIIMPSRPVRPIKWLLLRELWEHRALYSVPVMLGLMVLAGLFIGLMFGNVEGLPKHLDELTDPVSSVLVAGAIVGIASLYATTMPVVWAYYCMDALQAERRDRSILFWKSLPVSDLETVLSKLATVALVAPLISFVAMLGVQLIILLTGTVLFASHGYQAWRLWTQPALLTSNIAVAYWLLVTSLWYLPAYCWMLLVSVWARRSTLLWVLLPPVAIIVIEKIAFGTTHVLKTLSTWFLSGMIAGFNTNAASVRDSITFDRPDNPMHPMPDNLASVVLHSIDPQRFLSSPGLWVGLAIAAVLVVATIWLRRYRELLT